ncbi:unnamed protein product [Vicia faba]|uniref:Uncharacterized protein n=1 Tax=Vicia faba TaxID=3906 RepID=A0AAV1AUE0_VICFA|nr:unnamed protein product [Vicia faba]
MQAVQPTAFDKPMDKSISTLNAIITPMNSTCKELPSPDEEGKEAYLITISTPEHSTSSTKRGSSLSHLICISFDPTKRRRRVRKNINVSFYLRRYYIYIEILEDREINNVYCTFDTRITTHQSHKTSHVNDANFPISSNSIKSGFAHCKPDFSKNKLDSNHDHYFAMQIPSFINEFPTINNVGNGKMNVEAARDPVPNFGGKAIIEEEMRNGFFLIVTHSALRWEGDASLVHIFISWYGIV